MFVLKVCCSRGAPVQCVRQLGATSCDAAAVALAAGELCSKLGDARQAEALLRQAFTACKVVGGALERKCRAAYKVQGCTVAAAAAAAALL